MNPHPFYIATAIGIQEHAAEAYKRARLYRNTGNTCIRAKAPNVGRQYLRKAALAQREAAEESAACRAFLGIET